MDTKGYYKILGIDEKASQDEIKKAYRNKVKDCHPDRHPGDKEKEEEFKKVAEAYEHLSDPDKRKRYDSAAAGTHGFSGEPGFNFNFGEDPFEEFLRRATGQNRVDPTQVVNLTIQVQVSLADYFAEKTLKHHYQRVKPVGEKQKCPACQGQGSTVEMFFGRMQRVMCGNCNGSGQMTFAKREVETINIKLEKGALRYKVPGMGDFDGLSNYGALLVQLVLSPANGFSVDPQSMNLIYRTKISLVDFLVGADVIVDKFGTKYKLKHESVGEASRVYRLSGKGLQLPSGAYTDLLVEVTPKLSSELNDVEKELITKLSEQEHFSVQSQTP